MTSPNARFEAFKLLRTFPETIPVRFETWMLLRVFPYMRELFTSPNARFEALRFDRPALSPKYACALTTLRFDVPRTLRVWGPKMVAELAKRVVTFNVSMLAVPST